jgi:uncharacterized protein
MQFNVSGLLRDPVGATRRYQLDPEPPVHGGTVELLRVPQGVLVRADLNVFLDESCSRCLAPFSYPAHLTFEETFHQQVDVVSGARIPFDGEEESFLISLDHVIDIREAVRQYSEMAAEMQPLCRPDCPGLCPVCGRDLGTEVCACDQSPVDPRWSALSNLQESSRKQR